LEPLLSALLTALAASALLSFPVRWLVLALGAIDRPNDRSSHVVPTPRGGGLAIVLGTLIGVICFAPVNRDVVVFLASVSVVAGVSFFDDFRSLSFGIRLATQGCAALVLILGLGLVVHSVELPAFEWLPPYWVGLVLSILFVVGYCNFFNFMDGINGIAAIQAALCASTLALLLNGVGATDWSILAAAVAGAAIGFLPHNFPRARMFMGDVGSVTLGFTLAVLTMVAHSRGVPWPGLLLVHGAFLFDSVFTLIKRLSRGQNIFRPHREHVYQRLVQRGLSHTNSTLIYTGLGAVCCLAGYLYSEANTAGRWIALSLPLILFSIVALAAHRRILENPTPHSLSTGSDVS